MPFITPNMDLTLPVVNETQPGVGGDKWAPLLTQSLKDIDAQAYSLGHPAVPAGIDINADLDFKNHNATDMNSSGFARRLSLVPTSLTSSLSNYLGNPWWTRDDGSQVRLDQTGSITINGADPGAHYILQSATSSLANSRTLTAGPNITINDKGAGGRIEITGSAGGADPNAWYVTTALTASLPNERVLSAGPGIQIVDGGSGNAVFVNNIAPSDNNASYVVLSTTSSLSAERVLTAGPNITINDTGAGGRIEITGSAASPLPTVHYLGDLNVGALRVGYAGTRDYTLTGSYNILLVNNLGLQGASPSNNLSINDNSAIEGDIIDFIDVTGEAHEQYRGLADITPGTSAVFLLGGGSNIEQLNYTRVMYTTNAPGWYGGALKWIELIPFFTNPSS